MQVLTIHGAKGLEFGHVYLAQTHRSSRRGGEDAVAFERWEEGVAYRLFGSPTPAWFDRRKRRALVEAAERVRLLYVSMTRARDRLVVLGGFQPEPKLASWERADTAVGLLQHRAGTAEAVTQLAARASGGNLEPWTDEAGARWRLAASVEGAGSAEGGEVPAPEVAPLPTEGEIAAESAALAARRDAALLRMARPFHTRASDEGHLAGAEARAARRFAEGEASTPSGPGIERDAARAAGTAVHRILEVVDLAGDAAGDLARRSAELAGRLAPPEALDRARDLCRRIEANGLLERLACLGENVLARELPVLLPAEDEGEAGDGSPVGYVAGVIDLLYRDPETSQPVVADYKTDLVEDEAAIGERVEAYRPQGRAYARAVQEALGLEAPPRFELWFLHAGRVVTVS